MSSSKGDCLTSGATMDFTAVSAARDGRDSCEEESDGQDSGPHVEICTMNANSSLYKSCLVYRSWREENGQVMD